MFHLRILFKPFLFIPYPAMKIEQIHQIFLKSKGIATDTRKIQRNQLFFALKGDNFNGNRFASQAVKKSGSYAVIDEEEFATGESYILVPNVLETLQELATYHRKYLNLPILAITGSNGKTTSKELINAVLRRKFETIATQGNLNNHIGVPLTLLSMNRSTEFGIVEMGANHAGEIRDLCSIALPDFGYITNFGKAHLEGFGSVEGVIRAKSELYDHLRQNAKLIFLNIDDPIQQKQLEYPSVFTFGTSEKADVKIEYPETNKTAEVSFNENFYSSILTGNYNAVNMAAAICIGTYFKVSEEGISKAIASYVPKNNRSQLVHLGTCTLLMDAYNANPTSMRAALSSFQNYPAEKKWVILGDMFELGETSHEEHQEVINMLEEINLDRVFLVGKNFFQVSTSRGHISKYENFEGLEKELLAAQPKDCHILVKGSRGMALERVQELLQKIVAS